jgi:hypothetical protein
MRVIFESPSIGSAWCSQTEKNGIGLSMISFAMAAAFRVEEDPDLRIAVVAFRRRDHRVDEPQRRLHGRRAVRPHPEPLKKALELRGEFPAFLLGERLTNPEDRRATSQFRRDHLAVQRVPCRSASTTFRVVFAVLAIQGTKIGGIATGTAFAQAQLRQGALGRRSGIAAAVAEGSRHTEKPARALPPQLRDD